MIFDLIMYNWIDRTKQLNYTPIAFDKRVTFWLQRAGWPLCVCMFAALYVCVIA